MQRGLDYTERDLDKLVSSVIRWLCGLRPRYGRLHYFEMYAIREKIERDFRPSTDGRTCPLCGRTFPRRSALAAHVFQAHKLQILSAIKSYLRRQ